MNRSGIDISQLTAFDVHVHLEHQGALTDTEKAAVQHFKAGAAPRDWPSQAEYYRSRKIGCVVFTVDESLTGAARSRPTIKWRSSPPTTATSPSRSAASTRIAARPASTKAKRLVRRRVPRARPSKPASTRPGVLPQRSRRVSLVRGVRRGEAAGALSHRPQRHRHRHARRRRDPAEVRQSDADR